MPRIRITIERATRAQTVFETDISAETAARFRAGKPDPSVWAESVASTVDELAWKHPYPRHQYTATGWTIEDGEPQAEAPS